MRRVRVPARCSRRLGGSVRGLAIDPVCRCGGAGVRGTRGLSLPLPKASGGSRATPGGRARGCANWDLTLGGAGGPARRGASAGTSVACAERWASRTGVSRWHWGRRGRGAHFGRIGRPRLVHARCCALPCIAMGPAPGGGCRPKQGAGSVRTAYRGCRGAGFEGPRVCRARRDVHRVTRGGSACRLRQTGQLVRNCGCSRGGNRRMRRRGASWNQARFSTVGANRHLTGCTSCFGLRWNPGPVLNWTGRRTPGTVR